MIALIASLVISASGDPYISWSEQATLTIGQRSTFVSQILSRAPGVVSTRFASLRCIRNNGYACCLPVTSEPRTAAQIHATLASGHPWEPGLEDMTQRQPWPIFCVSGTALAQLANFVGNITTEADGQPIQEALFSRVVGTDDITLTTQFYKSFSEADCTAHNRQTLMPMGAEP